MLNKELMMLGGAGEEWWTLQLNLTGDSYIDLTLVLNTNQPRIIWQGTPNTDIVTVQIPPKSSLLLTQSVGLYRVITEDGCIAEDYARREIAITLLQSKAYLEVFFAA